MIAGTHEIETSPRTSKGEAGLHHLSSPLTGVQFKSEWDMRKFVDRLLTDVYGQGAVPVPHVEVNPRLGRRCQGRQYVGQNLIHVAPHMRIRTVVHELAHHVTETRYGDLTAHGQTFKAVLRELLERTYMMLDRPVPSKPAARPLPPVNTEVMFEDGRGQVHLGRVIKTLRVNCRVMTENGLLWTCKATALEWDE